MTNVTIKKLTSLYSIAVLIILHQQFLYLLEHLNKVAYEHNNFELQMENANSTLKSERVNI